MSDSSVQRTLLYDNADAVSYRFHSSRLIGVQILFVQAVCDGRMLPDSSQRHTGECKQLLSSSTRLLILLRVRVVIRVRLHIAIHSSGVQSAATITTLAHAFIRCLPELLVLHFFLKKTCNI